MHRNLKFAFAAAVSAAFLMAAATVEATTITKNGSTLVSDTYEGDPPGLAPVADVGTWVAAYGGLPAKMGDVWDDAANPGPAPGGGSQYFKEWFVGRELGGELGTIVAGDIVKFNSMVYIPTAEETIDYPWQLRLGSFDIGAAAFVNVIFNFWRNSDGTFTDQVGGNFTGPSTLQHGVWQEWTMEKEFGTAIATWTVEGESVNIVSASVVDLPVGAEPYILGIVTNGNSVLYLDDVVSVAILADINGDGQVDGLDLNLLGADWQSTNPTTPAADINGDGIVDGLDLNILGGLWQAGVPAPGASIPEPASLALLGLGAIAMLRRRK